MEINVLLFYSRVHDSGQPENMEQWQNANHTIYIDINERIIQSCVLTRICGNVSMTVILYW